MGKIMYKGKEYSRREFAGPAVNVKFNKGDTGMQSQNVQAAIVEIWNASSSSKLDSKITNIQIGTNPTTKRAALEVRWTDGGATRINYIDFTN